MRKNFGKAAVIFLAICLVLTFTACGDKGGSSDGVKIDTNDLYGTYTAVSKQLADASSASMDMSMDISMNISGESTNLSMSGPVKYIYNDDRTDLQMYLKLSTDILGGSYDIETWYKDGWAYTSAMGTKTKVQQSIDTMLKSANTTTVEFPESAIVDKKSEDVSDGTKISFTIKGDALEAITKDAMGSIGSDMSSILEGYTIKYEDASVSTVIDKDGNLKSYDMELTFSMSEGSDSFEMTLKMSLDDIVLGDVTIDYPADLDDYTETAE